MMKTRLAKASARLAKWGIETDLLPPGQPKRPAEPEMPDEDTKEVLEDG